MPLQDYYVFPLAMLTATMSSFERLMPGGVALNSSAKSRLEAVPYTGSRPPYQLVKETIPDRDITADTHDPSVPFQPLRRLPIRRPRLVSPGRSFPLRFFQYLVE